MNKQTDMFNRLNTSLGIAHLLVKEVKWYMKTWVTRWVELMTKIEVKLTTLR